MDHAEGNHRKRGSRHVRTRERHGLTGLLRTFLRPYARPVSLVVVLLVLQCAGNLSLPSLSAGIINNGVLKGDTGYIWRIGGIMLGITLIAGVVAIVIGYWVARVSMGFGADVRAAIYRRVRGFSVGEMNRFGIPSLITRNINDVQQVQMFLQMALTLLVTSAIMSVGGVILAIREGAALSLLLAVSVPVTILVIGLMLLAVLPLFRSVQVKVDRINQVLREQITGVRVIRAFLRTRSEQDRFRDANADLTGTSLRAYRIFVVVAPVLTVILALTNVSAIWFGGRFVSEGSLPIGNLIAFLSYIQIGRAHV